MENHALPNLSLNPWLGDSREGTVVGGGRYIRGKFGKFSHSGRATGKLSTMYN